MAQDHPRESSEMNEKDLRARYIRLVNILSRIVYDIDRLDEDEFYADYDDAVAGAKKLLLEEGVTPPQQV